MMFACTGIALFSCSFIFLLLLFLKSHCNPDQRILFEGCNKEVRILESKSRRSADARIPHPNDDVNRAKGKASLEDDCEDDTAKGAPLLKEKIKIKSLQKSIHKNLLKLFHKLKTSQPGMVMPDRKEYTNFAAQMPMSEARVKLTTLSPVVRQTTESISKQAPQGDVAKTNSSNESNKVSTGVPLSKTRDDLKNVTGDGNATSALNSMNKLVNTVLPNVTSSQHNTSTNASQMEAFDDGSGSGMEPTKLPKEKSDPYAAIAAGPDHPKLPPDLKIPAGGSEAEEPPVVGVGVSGGSKSDGEKDGAQNPAGEEGKTMGTFVFPHSSGIRNT